MQPTETVGRKAAEIGDRSEFAAEVARSRPVRMDFLHELVQTASETTSSAQQISLSTQQQRTASNQVVVALKEIVTASADTADSVRRIALVAQSMIQLSTTLNSQVEQFVLDEASAAARAPDDSVTRSAA